MLNDVKGVKICSQGSGDMHGPCTLVEVGQFFAYAKREYTYEVTRLVDRGGGRAIISGDSAVSSSLQSATFSVALASASFDAQKIYM